MRKDKSKVSVKYNKSDKFVVGYYPNHIVYPNETFKDDDNIGFIEISNDQWLNRPKQAIVDISLLTLKSYEETDDEILQEAKDKKIEEVRYYTKSLITSKYSPTAQLNILMSGDNIKISDMNAKIESIIIKSRLIRSKIMNKDCDTLEKLNEIDTNIN